MKVNKEAVRKNALVDLARRMEYLEAIVLRLRGEQVVLNRIADAMPKDRDGQRSVVAKLIDSSGSKVMELSRDISGHVSDGRNTLALLKAAL